MRIEGKQLILGERTCHCHHFPYGAGKIAGKKACSECEGTGKGKRGKDRGCKKCYGFTTEPDFVNLIVCPTCQGEDRIAEIDTDPLADEDFRSLPFRVVREDRGSTWLEEYLPLGSCWSSIDYGRSWQLSDEELIAQVKAAASNVQACKVSRDGRLCDEVLIILHRQGYRVDAVFAK
jgi:hypothetical protein